MTTTIAPSSQLTGTWEVIRLDLRRDRVKLPAWVLGISFMAVYFTTALPILFGGEEGLSETAGGFLTQGVVAIFGGPGYGMDDLTFPRLFVGVYGLYIIILAAVMSILMVTRHTRAEEESGRSELVRASLVGRMAPLTAAIAVTLLANFILSILIGAVLVGRGYEAGDSFLFGAGVGAAGIAFAAVTAVTVQLSEFSRTASGLAGIALGGAYVIRMAGDAIEEHGSALSWLSPLAWPQQTRAFVDARWWPLLLSVLFAAGTIAIGYALARRRDFGAGLLRPRPGPARAPKWLDSPLALALRLHRGALLGWVAILAVWGYGNGAIVEPVVEGLAGVSTDVLEIFGGNDAGTILVDGYLATMGIYNASMVAIYAVLAVLSVRSEELEGRTEPVLATATSRWDWLGSHIVVLALGSMVLLAVTGVAMGAGAALGMGDSEVLWDVLASHVAFIPAVLVILATAGLLYGVVPRATGAAWALVAYGFFMGFFAPVMDLPQWVLNLSPMEHVPGIPLEEFSIIPLAALMVVAVALASLGLVTFRNRDSVAN